MTGPGWYPDPAGVPGRLRYGDGQAWTPQVIDNGPAEGSDGAFFFLGEATKERSDVIAVMNQLSAGLAVR